MIEALQAYGPFLVYVNRAGDPKQRARDLFDQFPGAAVVGRSPTGSLYELPRKTPAVPTDSSAAELPIASVQVSVHQKVVAGMSDRMPSTRWDTGGPQLPGNEVSRDARTDGRRLPHRTGSRPVAAGLSARAAREPRDRRRPVDDGVGGPDRGPGACTRSSRIPGTPRCSSPCRPALRRIASS